MGSFILSLCFSKKPINYHFTSEAYLILDDTVSVLVTLFLLLHILVRSIFHCFSLPIQDFLCQFWHITSHMDYAKRKKTSHTDLPCCSTSIASSLVGAVFMSFSLIDLWKYSIQQPCRSMMNIWKHLRL
jgi:hypothetical protein